MSAAADFFARWRVRLGYPLAILVLWFARPTFWSIAWAIPIGIVGLLVRGSAAGHLHKQEVLTVTGPYAYTRNPLYFGSALLAAGVAVATHSLISAAILVGYFALFYSAVMRREEGELRGHHPGSFEEYVRAVPLFVPRFKPARLSFASAGSFSWSQYRKNHEYQASIGFALLLGAMVLIWWLRSR